jgi:hypothetical protein
MNNPDITWRGAWALAQASVIEIAMRAAATQLECGTCGRATCQSPGFCRLCRAADRNAAKERGDQEIERLRSTPTSLVEAIVYSLRQGPNALERPDNLRRLGRLSEEQLREIYDRVQRFREDLQHDGKKMAPWTAEQARALIDKWTETQHG